MSHEAALRRLGSIVEAWPLASRNAYDLRLTHLGRSHQGSLVPTSAALWSGLESHLRATSTISILGLEQLRDRVWFDAAHEPKSQRRAHTLSMTSYTLQLAADYLEDHGRGVGLARAHGPDWAARMERWRHLSTQVPSDLLIAAVFAAAPLSDPPTDRVSLATPLLTRVLEEPVANTHLHMGAAASFDRLWTGLMGRGIDLLGLAFKHEIDVPFGEPRRFARLLLVAALSRLVLARFLFLREHTTLRATFASACAAPTGRRDTLLGVGDRDLLLTGMRCLVSGDIVAPIARLAREYRRLGGVQPFIGDDVDAVVHADPLASWLAPAPGRALPETRLATRALRYAHAHPHDEAFETLFWQYQRVRSITFAHLVHQPSTIGLDFFQRYYDRLRVVRPALGRTEVRGALQLESRDVHLRAIEVRTGPDTSWADVTHTVRGVARQACAIGRDVSVLPEFGLVFHFIRTHRCGCGRAHADPNHAAWRVRYGSWFHARRQEALALAGALRRRPELLLLLRGIDVASIELAIATWVLRPLFDVVDRAAAQAAATLSRSHAEWSVTPLRHTIHAGEDFARIAEGVRRVHEPFESGLLRPGDRIGHAVAIGIDPARWASRHPEAPQAKEERLDDLLWELDRYALGDFAPPDGRIPIIEASALLLGRDIFGHCHLADLVEARRLRHANGFLERVAYPNVRIHHANDAWGLAHRHLTDADVYARGRAVVMVENHPTELAMLAAAQRWLRALLARNEITIETNPSSNVFISDLGGMDQHPLVLSESLEERPQRDDVAVMSTLSDDDPLTFATCLADEYAHLYAAFLRAGIGARDALRVMDRVRENGWRSRFTLPASATMGALGELRDAPRARR
jgi:hypothetical protein